MNYFGIDVIGIWWLSIKLLIIILWFGVDGDYSKCIYNFYYDNCWVWKDVIFVFRYKGLFFEY